MRSAKENVDGKVYKEGEYGKYEDKDEKKKQEKGTH